MNVFVDAWCLHTRVSLQGSNPISQERLEEAVRVIISYQNRDGGMATYENTRSFHAMEVRRWGKRGVFGSY